MILRYKNDLIGAMPKVTASGTVTTVTQALDHLSVIKERDPKSPAYPDRPRAYLNFVLFDEDFNLVEGSSGVKQVAATPDELQTLAQDNVIMEKSGFLYVYTSNETQQDVFFDNVTVALAGTPVLEETHYFPFGLAINGLSEQQAIGKENKYRYNGIERIGDLGLEDYDAKFRELDPQIGRWWQLDPKIESMGMWSPYSSKFDNPIRFNDFLGDEPGGPDDPVKRIGMVTGGEYSFTAPKDFGSSILFAGEYTLGLLNEGIEAVNIYLNPVVPAAELATGKSYGSGFTEDKSRLMSAFETALTFNPYGKAASKAERALVSLDNNALVAATKEGKKDVIKGMIGNDKPIVSFTAAKEYLAAHSKSELRGFMTEIGATISKKGGSVAQVMGLTDMAKKMKRALGFNDGMILAGAMNNNAKVITGDKKFFNFMQAINWPSSNYHKAK